MSLIINDPPEALLPDDEVATWRSIPTAVISDELNRACTMAGAVKPIAEGLSFAGQALTVQTMVGVSMWPCITPWPRLGRAVSWWSMRAAMRIRRFGAAC